MCIYAVYFTSQHSFLHPSPPTDAPDSYHMHSCLVGTIITILGQGSTNEREHVTFGFLAWLISLSMVISNYIHFPASDIISFSLWLSSTPVINLYIIHILFIYSLFVG
jgi:hypothetical protein